MTETRPLEMPAPTGLVMSPAPSEEEAAAILAAHEALWPRPVATVAAPPPPRNTSWRFGNRWWSLPVPARRNRPWR